MIYVENIINLSFAKFQSLPSLIKLLINRGFNFADRNFWEMHDVIVAMVLFCNRSRLSAGVKMLKKS